MALKFKTILVIIVILALAALVIELITIYWATVGITLIFLFMGSMFFFIFLDFEEPKLPKLNNWPSVSVVIPCYNSEDTIRKCVESAKQMSYPQKFEIIVVNDASTDSSLAILNKIKGITIINKTQNKGKASAINSAIRIAKGEIICAVDSDTFASLQALKRTVPFFKDKNVGATTCLIRVFEPNTFFKKVQDIEYLLGFGFYQTMLSHVDAAMVTPGPMCVYRKSALEKIGGYDEQNITEDMEIALRLQNNGYKIKAGYTAQVETVVPNTIKQWVRQRIRWYRGKIFNTLKYRELLFNPKHGFLGSFSLPFTFILETASIFILFLIVVLLFQSSIFALAVIFSALSVNYPLPLYVPSLIIHSSAIFFFITTLSTFGFGLMVAFFLSKEKFKLKYIAPIAFIIFLYGIMVALMWFLSLFKEINRSEYSW